MKRLAKLSALVLSLTVLPPVALPWMASAQADILVSIIHNGQVIRVGPMAAAKHILLHGDTLANPDCPPNCNDDL